MGSYDLLIEVSKQLPEDVKAKLLAIHDKLDKDHNCVAHEEGLSCCLDYLLGRAG